MRRQALLRAARAVVPPATAVATGLVAVAPALAVAGIVATRAGGDSPFLLHRTQQMATALAGLHLPPRWMPDAAYGLGYPFWTFYAPLAYLVSGLLAMLGGGVIGGVKVVQALAFAVAALGAYLLAARTWRGAAAGVLAAAAYTFAPYHLVNVYVRGDALSEITAYALFPWALLAVDRVVRRPGRSAVAGLAVLSALLLLSHNISALLFAPVIAAYSVARLLPVAAGRPGARPIGVRARDLIPLPRGFGALPAAVQRAVLVAEWWLWPLRGRPRARAALALAAGALLGAGLAAWFVAPAIAESGAVQLRSNLTGYFDYRGHFRGLDLLDGSLAFDYRAAAPWRTGLVQLLVGVAGAVVALRSPRMRRVAAFWLAVAVVATLMATSLSAPVWDAVSPLRFVQFPWRWLSIQALGLAMLSGALATPISFGVARLRPRVAAIAWRALTGGASAAIVVVLLAASAMRHLPVDPLAVTDPTHADLQAFEIFSGNIGSTVRAEYLPVDVRPRPMSGTDAVHGREGGPRALDPSGSVVSAELIAAGPASQTWRLEATGPEQVPIAFSTLMFPGWTATIVESSGPMVVPREEATTPRQPRAVPGSGWLVVDLPPGRHVVRLDLQRTAVRAAAEVTSLAALALLAMLALAGGRRLVRWSLGALAVLLVLVFAARAMPRAVPEGPRALDFVRAPYPTYHPDGIEYDGILLTEADLSSTAMDAGGELRVEAVFEGADEDHRVEAALVSPAEAMPLDVPDVRVTAERSTTEGGELSLMVPPDVASGLYFVRLRVLGPDGEVEGRLPSGTNIGRPYLGPVRVRGQRDYRDRPGSPVARIGEVSLHAVQAEQHDRRLEVRLYWETSSPLARELKTSIRLVDADERVVAQVDALPLYGFLPATSWEPGAIVLDRRWLDLPSDARGDHRIEVVVYEEPDPDRPLGTGIVSGVAIAGES